MSEVSSKLTRICNKLEDLVRVFLFLFFVLSTVAECRIGKNLDGLLENVRKK